jgi:hypothetical protein
MQLFKTFKDIERAPTSFARQHVPPAFAKLIFIQTGFYFWGEWRSLKPDHVALALLIAFVTACLAWKPVKDQSWWVTALARTSTIFWAVRVMPTSTLLELGPMEMFLRILFSPGTLLVSLMVLVSAIYGWPAPGAETADIKQSASEADQSDNPHQVQDSMETT